VYFGNLSPVVDLVQALLRPGDFFVFSVELADDPVHEAAEGSERESKVCEGSATGGSRCGSGPASWLLQRSGRFAHSAQYILDLSRRTRKVEVDGECEAVHGWTVRTFEKITPRFVDERHPRWRILFNSASMGGDQRPGMLS